MIVKGKEQYFPTLDGWRAIAILLVMVSHIALWTPRPRTPLGFSVWLQLRRFGDNGVEIFFCLSGFLITSLLIREYRENNQIVLRAFYVRRIARIMPAALTYLLFLALFADFGPIPYFPITTKEAIASIFFLRNYMVPVFGTAHWFTNHFWSLSVEEHFYLIWPCLLAVTRLRARWYAVVAIAGIVVWRHAHLMKGGLLFRTDLRADALLLGALAALTYPTLKLWLSGRRLWLAVLVTSYVISDYGVRQAEFPFARLAREASVVAAIAFCLANDRIFVSKMLEWQPFRLLGTLSYSLYLWQQFFLNHYFSAYRAWEVPVRVVLTFICAFLCYRFIERPFIRMGHERSSALLKARRCLNADGSGECDQLSVVKLKV